MQLTVDNVTLAYDVAGEGQPILFVHGFPLSSELWRPAVARLEGWKCYLPDLRGHGRSTPSPRVSIERYTDDLVAILDAEGETRPAVVCGLSMGGTIALDFFRRYRTRTRALVLCDCRATPESPEGRRRREDVAQTALEKGSGAVADTLVEKLFAAHADPELKERWRSLMAATPAEGVAAASRALANRLDALPLLGRIDVPVVLIFGQEDAITPPEVGRDMQNAIPGSRLMVIPDAGHLPPVEQPEAFANSLRAFLRML